MTVDVLVLILMWVIGLLSFIFFTPKNRKRRFILAFFICQTLTWLDSLLLVKFHLIAFPVREFPKASDLLLTVNYFFIPLLCGFYIISKPKRNYFVRLVYLSIWVTGTVLLIVLLEKYTNLIEYIHYAWYWSWLDFFGVYTISKGLYQWFFKDMALFQTDEGAVQ